MTSLTVKELHERAENKINSQLLGRIRDLKDLELELGSTYTRLTPELIQTQIDATLNEIDTLEYIVEAIEVYSNLSKFNRE